MLLDVGFSIKTNDPPGWKEAYRRLTDLREKLAPLAAYQMVADVPKPTFRRLDDWGEYDGVVDKLISGGYQGLRALTLETRRIRAQKSIEYIDGLIDHFKENAMDLDIQEFDIQELGKTGGQILDDN
jgi:hypothetical protein